MDSEIARSPMSTPGRPAGRRLFLGSGTSAARLGLDAAGGPGGPPPPGPPGPPPPGPSSATTGVAASLTKAPWRGRYRVFVLVTAGLHAITAAVILAIGLPKDWPVLLCASYSSWQPADPTKLCGPANLCSVVTRYKRVGKVSPIALLAAFCALSALFQGAPALMRRTWELYISYLDQCQQPLRWAEYSLSSSLMVVVILILNGNSDFWIYLGAVGINWATMLFGLLHEKLLFTQSALERETSIYAFAALEKTLAHGAGWVSFALVWLLIISQFTWSINDATATAAASHHSFPKWVTAVVWTQFLLFLLFGANQLAATLAQLGYLRWARWTYLKSEVAYTVLSLCAKQLLVWLLFFGTIVRNPKELVVASPCA